MGNKLDAQKDRQVTKNDGQQVAIAHNLIFHEVSAKTGDNVITLFNDDISEQILSIYQDYFGTANEEKEVEEKEEKVDINKPKAKGKSKCC